MADAPSAFRIFWSEAAHEVRKTLSLGFSLALDELLAKLRAGDFPKRRLQLTPGRYQKSLGYIEIERRTHDLSDPKTLAGMMVEVSLLNTEIGNVPGQYFMLWTLWISALDGLQEIRIWEMSGFRALESKLDKVRRILALMGRAQGVREYLRDTLERPTVTGLGPKCFPQWLAVELPFGVRTRFFPDRRNGAEDEEQRNQVERAAQNADGDAVGGTIVSADTIENAQTRLVLTPEQGAAVDMVGPVFLQGRSGTAKTTVLEHRCLQALKRGELAVFLTASPLLAANVEKHFGEFLLTTNDAAPAIGRDARMQAQLGEDRDGRLQTELRFKNFEAVPKGPVPLFLTYLQFLRMLDASIPDGDAFFAESMSAETQTATDRIVGPSPSALSSGGSSSAARGFDPTAELTYPQFEREYWPKLPQKSKPKGVHAHDVYREMLLIKVDGLAQSKYCRKPPPDSSDQLSEQDRGYIFDLYLKYEKLRAERRHWDAVDAARTIWARHERYKELLGQDSGGQGYSGRPVGALLVDECQVGGLLLMVDECQVVQRPSGGRAVVGGRVSGRWAVVVGGQVSGSAAAVRWARCWWTSVR